MSLRLYGVRARSGGALSGSSTFRVSPSRPSARRRSTAADKSADDQCSAAQISVSFFSPPASARNRYSRAALPSPLRSRART